MSVCGHLGNDRSAIRTFQTILRSSKAFLFDCDGVLWRGGHEINGARKLIEVLHSHGRRVLFVTNNSTKSRTSYVQKIQQVLGIQVNERDVFGSAFATATLLADKAPSTKKVFVVGEGGLVDELQAVGIEPLGGNQNDIEFEFGTFDPAKHLDKDVGAVVCGFDAHFNYPKLAVASSYLLYQPKCLFIVSNLDSTFPSPHAFLPGGGSVIASIEKAVNRGPDFVAGKPSSSLFELIQRHGDLDCTADEMLMIGDRLDTDIVFGNANGMTSVLVTTGVTSETDLNDRFSEEMNEENKHLAPQFISSGVHQLLEIFEESMKH